VDLPDLETANGHISRMTHPADSVGVPIILVRFLSMLSPAHPTQIDMEVE